MTAMEDLIAHMLRVAAALEETNNPVDQFWAMHLRVDARGIELLAATARHLE